MKFPLKYFQKLHVYLVSHRRLLGLSVLALITLANPVTLFLAARRNTPFAAETVENILLGDAFLLIISFGCLCPRAAAGLVERLRLKELARWLLAPVYSKFFWVTLVPFFLASILRQVPVWEHTPYIWKDLLLGASIIENAVASALMHTGVIALAVKIVRHPCVGWITAILLALLDFFDWAFLYYGHMRINFAMFVGGGQERAVDSYANLYSAAMLLIFLSCSVFTVITLRQLHAQVNYMMGQRRLAWFAVFTLLSPTLLFKRASTAFMPAVDRDIVSQYLREVEPMTQSPLMSIIRVALRTKNAIPTSHYTAEEVALLAPYRYEGSSPEPLPGPPFRRIILVTVESLSLNLISRYNPRLPGQLTPFLDQLPTSVGNFRSVALPTQFGLASHLCSHPYGIGLVELGHPNALPAYLAKNGWTTAFFQSAPLDFQRGSRRLEELGYQMRFGRDEAAQRLNLQKHISGWGLRDRYVYIEALDYLKTHRSERVFLHILTADTHSPVGRIDYGDQDYPPSPAWTKQFGVAQEYLQSVFRADFDLSQFFENIKASDLWDTDTAIIITADHNCPRNPIYMRIPRSDQDPIERIPWILLSPRALPQFSNARLTSQIDTAPTIAHLAGLHPLPGWWGQSLFQITSEKNQLAWRENGVFTITRQQLIERAPPDLQHVATKIEVR